MHTSCLQIRNTAYDSDGDMSVSEVEDILIENHYVDYVQDYDNPEAELKDFLTCLSEHGCDVDFSKNTFTVVDVEEFCAWLLREIDVYYKENYELITWKDKAELVHSALSALYFCNPTVCDGCGYGNLFEAVRYAILGFHNPQREYKPVTYELVGVYDCHN